MKKSFLRMVGLTLLLALAIGAIVGCIGWLAGWKTGTQFSNGLFLPGALVIVAGLFSVMGGWGMRSDFRVVYSQSAGDMSVGERTKRWMADINQGYGAFVSLLLTGGFLVALAVLVGMIYK